MLSSRHSVFQTSNWYNLHAISPCISHLTTSQHKQQVRLSQSLCRITFIILPHKTLNLQQMSRGIFDFTTSQFTFY